jgi:hypothetical protein
MPVLSLRPLTNTLVTICCFELNKLTCARVPICSGQNSKKVIFPAAVVPHRDVDAENFYEARRPLCRTGNPPDPAYARMAKTRYGGSARRRAP